MLKTELIRERAEVLSATGAPRTLEDILGAAREGEIQDLPLILKADTPGSLEALKGEIDKLDHPEVRVKFVHDGVGGVNESDVYLASVSGAIIIAFHVIAEDRAKILADNEGVEIRRFNIIYEITDTIKQALEGSAPTGKSGSHNRSGTCSENIPYQPVRYHCRLQDPQWDN